MVLIVCLYFDVVHHDQWSQSIRFWFFVFACSILRYGKRDQAVWFYHSFTIQRYIWNYDVQNQLTWFPLAIDYKVLVNGTTRFKPFWPTFWKYYNYQKLFLKKISLIFVSITNKFGINHCGWFVTDGYTFCDRWLYFLWQMVILSSRFSHFDVSNGWSTLP